jgi:hypothetical protein
VGVEAGVGVVAGVDDDAAALDSTGVLVLGVVVVFGAEPRLSFL